MGNILDCAKISGLSETAKNLGSTRIVIKNFFMKEQPLYDKTAFALRRLSLYLDSMEKECAKREIPQDEQKEMVREAVRQLAELNYEFALESSRRKERIINAIFYNPVGALGAAFKASKFMKEVHGFARDAWEKLGLLELKPLSDMATLIKIKNNEFMEKINK